ncbi:MAG: class II aldolase/adducin family protein [Ardenticatenaceae bacterium]|nr:class II aldolase/adducin family protein [Ardenticatenaceae bacterium]
MEFANDPRPLMVEVAHLLYDRYLTNSAGGNISCRVGDHVFVSPRYLGSKYRWRLTEEMVVVLDREGQALAGDARSISRESKMHFACYHTFPEINGVVHCHPRYLSVFAAAGRPLVPTNEYTEKFGTVEVVPPLPSHSQALADHVVAALRPRQEQLKKHGLGLILAWHGMVTVGRDLADAYDTLERLEWSAHTLLMSSLLPDLETLPFGPPATAAQGERR